MLESSFQSRALSYLNSVQGCRAENVSGNAMQSGRPDITGCYKGRMFKLELKVPDHRNSATKKQLLELKKWESVGCAVGVIYSMSALKEFVDALSRKERCSAFYQEENGCESWFQL